MMIEMCVCQELKRLLFLKYEAFTWQFCSTIHKLRLFCASRYYHLNSVPTRQYLLADISNFCIITFEDIDTLSFWKRNPDLI